MSSLSSLGGSVSSTASSNASSVNPTGSNPLNSVSAILGNQLNRLIRTKWTDPNMLAQELYSMFSAINQSAGSSTPITWNAPSNPSTPSQTFQGISPNQPILSFVPVTGPTINLTPSGFTANGLPIPGLQFPSSVGPGTSAQPSQQPQQSGGGQAGWVISAGEGDQISEAFAALDEAVGAGDGVGGSPYQVKLVNGEIVMAVCGQLAEDDEIPEGTFVILAEVDGKYYFQVPIWLDDLDDSDQG